METFSSEYLAESQKKVWEVLPRSAGGPPAHAQFLQGQSAAVTRADPAEGQGPASWPSSGTSPKPDVPALLPLAGKEP